MKKHFRILLSACAMIGFATAGSALAASGSYPATHRPSNEVAIENGNNANVELHFKGADRIHIALNGTLEIVNTDGHVWYYRPEIHQTIAGKTRTVDAKVDWIDKDRVMLRLGKVDPTAPVIVSPTGHSPALM